MVPSLCASVSMQIQPNVSYLLKFTTPFGIPVGVLKAGRSFSPSLMAFIRNTWKGQRALGWVGCSHCRRVPLVDKPPALPAPEQRWHCLRLCSGTGRGVSLAPLIPGSVV